MIIKELRKQKGVTQKELARVIHVTDDSVYNWEKGRSEPSIADLINMADYFQVTVDYLIGRVEI